MMRRSLISLSGSPSPVAAAGDIVAFRLVGCRGAPLSRAAIGKLAAKASGLSARERALTALAEAVALASAGGSYAAAAASATLAAQGDLLAFANGVKAQSLVHQLQVDASLAKVSGAATSAHVPRLHNDVHAALESLGPDSSIDAALLAAEHALGGHLNRAEEAHRLLAVAERGLPSLAASTAPAPAEVDFLRRAVTRAAASGATGDFAKIVAPFAAISAEHAALIKTLRPKYGLTSATVTDEEAEPLLVVAVLAAGEARGIELVPTRFDMFAPWKSAASHLAVAAASEITGEPVDESVTHSLSDAAIAQALHKSGGTDVASLVVGGHAFADAGGRVSLLLEQTAERIRFGKAVALAQMGDTAAALALLSDIERKNAYADMWRVFLVKGQTLRTEGKLVDSDKAFAALHALKRRRGADIPLMDEHRYKNAF